MIITNLTSCLGSCPGGINGAKVFTVPCNGPTLRKPMVMQGGVVPVQAMPWACVSVTNTDTPTDCLTGYLHEHPQFVCLQPLWVQCVQPKA